MDRPNMRVAVVTGGHSYDVIGLRDLFAGLPGVQAYVQSLDDFASSTEDPCSSARTARAVIWGERTET